TSTRPSPARTARGAAGWVRWLTSCSLSCYYCPPLRSARCSCRRCWATTDPPDPLKGRHSTPERRPFSRTRKEASEC
ncbi:hypothetical protein GA0070618_0001, partial [Micromonospora echinospora]